MQTGLLGAVLPAGQSACRQMRKMYEIIPGLNGKPALPEDRAGFFLYKTRDELSFLRAGHLPSLL